MNALWTASRAIVAVTALALAGARAAPTDPVPTFDVDPGCRAATTAAVSSNRDENACKADEKTARDKLELDWGRYSAGQRAHCVRLSILGGLPSYVELLTCLELAKAAAELPDDGMTRGGRIER